MLGNLATFLKAVCISHPDTEGPGLVPRELQVREQEQDSRLCKYFCSVGYCRSSGHGEKRIMGQISEASGVGGYGSS